jgi:hypothetical protein
LFIFNYTTQYDAQVPYLLKKGFLQIICDYAARNRSTKLLKSEHVVIIRLE